MINLIIGICIGGLFWIIVDQRRIKQVYNDYWTLIGFLLLRTRKDNAIQYRKYLAFINDLPWTPSGSEVDRVVSELDKRLGK